MAYQSKYTGLQIDDILDSVEWKQGKIEDLASIRAGAQKGATALQSYTEKYTGTVTGIKINGVVKSGSGVIDLGTIESKTLTESDIAAMGFTKNAGTYSKPSGGIPKSDLTSAVQTSLGKADTALQSYTEQYKGTITGVSANGTSVATSGVANIPAASTSAYGVTKLNSATNSTSTTEAATPSAVKSAYDLANSYKGTVTGVKINGTTKSPSSGVVDLGTVITTHQDISGKQDKLVSGTNIKTINGKSILGSGDIIISGGSSSEDIKVLVLEMEYLPEVGETGVFENIDFLNKILEYSSVFVKTFNALFPCSYQDGTIIIHGLEQQFELWVESVNYEQTSWECHSVVNTHGGSGAYSEVNHGTSDTIFTLTPNIFHVWDEVSALTLTLDSETSGVANEFLFQFTSGATPTSLTLPDDIKWANDSAPTITENKIYQISILNGLAVAIEFERLSLIVNRGVYNQGDMMSGATLTFEYPVASDITLSVSYYENETTTLPKGETTLLLDYFEPLAPKINSFNPLSDDVYIYEIV